MSAILVRSGGSRQPKQIASYTGPGVGQLSFANGYFFLTPQTSDVIFRSIDGLTWTSHTPPVVAFVRKVVFGNGVFVAIATGSNSSNGLILFSSNGADWSLANVSAGTTTPLDDVEFGGGVFVGVSSGRVVRSTDGINWSVQTIPAADSWFAVAFGNGTFVVTAVNNSNDRALTSPDGITWTIRTIPSVIPFQRLTFGAGVFMATGTDPSFFTSIIYSSPDGITWTYRAPGVNFPTGIVWTGRRFIIATAFSTIPLQSYNGGAWEDGPASLRASARAIAAGAGRVVSQYAASLSDHTIYVQTA